MRVSVITVCRNAQETIEETIQSVLGQTYKEIEYVIIDGNSTDSTLETIKKYERNIGYLKSEKDKNLYDAMNKGIRAATGDVLFFLNADDVFYDDYVVEKIVKEFQCSNAEVIYGDIYIADQFGTIIELKKHDDVDKVFFAKHTITQQAVFFGKQAFEKCGGFNDNYSIAGDSEWLLRAFFKDKLSTRYVEMPIATFRRGGISTDTQFFALMTEERIKLLKTYFSTLERLVYHGEIIRLLNKSKRLKKFVVRMLDRG